MVRLSELKAQNLHLERELDMVMFTHADKDRDGLLSPQEYVQFRHGDFESNPAFQDVMRKMDLHHAEQQFNKWDTDKSGELDFHEFVTHLMPQDFCENTVMTRSNFEQVRP